MDTDLTALATAGATVLVQQMAADGWAAVRDRVAALFSRGNGDGVGGQDGADDGADGADGAVRTVRRELDSAREEFLAAREEGDEDAAADVMAEWRGRLRRTLRSDPRLVGELRALLDEWEPDGRERSGGATYNTISGGVQHGAVIQAGSVGAVTFGPPPRGGRAGGGEAGGGEAGSPGPADEDRRF